MAQAVEPARPAMLNFDVCTACHVMTRPNLAIAAARPDQLAEVRALAETVWRAHYPGIIAPEQIEYMLARGYSDEALAPFVDGPECGLDIALVDGAPAGFAAWYATDRIGEVKLDKLYVLPAAQRGGVGGALIAHVAAKAREAGAVSLILNVNKHNAQAIRAYEKHGFAVKKAVVVDIGEGYVMDDYVMEKRL
jgi:GNAT superfamily N-acetyltransferase